MKRTNLLLFTACLAGLSILSPGEISAQGGRPDKITVVGRATDTDGAPLAGAYVLVKGTTVGTSTDKDGSYSITFSPVPGKAGVLVFSFIGMESQEVSVSSSTSVSVTLKADNQIDEVVVNGFYSQPKETFTGAATTLSGEDLLNISSTDLVGSIAALTPGMIVMENNAMGSNPNAIPSILIRGANTLITNESEEGINNPLIMLDGTEISMEELYDLDIFDIERVDVLKDASATILYGEKGANGVIVIERKRVDGEKLRLNYNFVPDFSIPDLSSFNLTNAEQKLEVERLAGLYDKPDGSMERAYDEKLQNIRRGVNTNWLKTPLRVPFSHNHSLSLSTRTESLEFRTNANVNDTYGVMKGDNRRSFGLNFNIGYHLKDRITLNFRSSFGLTGAKDSPYGSFTQYVRMNPYNPVYDEAGELIRMYYFNPFATSSGGEVNPLYDATLSSFSKTRAQSLRNSLSGRWNVTRNFYMTGQANLGLTWGSGDKYVSPETAANLLKPSLTDRGSYSFSRREGLSTDGKIVLNYGRSLDGKGSMFRVSGGTNIQYSRSRSAASEAIGFLKDNLSDISFALKYNPNGHPSGVDNISTQVGFFANANVGLWNRYFIDASYRTSGSSRFGASNSFAPFWAMGAGWNIHNEPFAKGWKWLNTLTFRYSMGYTGSVSFDYYQAKTVHEYKSQYLYYTGIGALPRQMGNPELKWQRTFNSNFGLTGAFLDNRIHVSVDFYSNTTYDMLMPVKLPPSVGTNSVNVNFGRINNKGLDLSVSAQIIRTGDWFWSTTITGGHVMDKIRNISNSLKGTEVSSIFGNELPKILFVEGGSQFDIYAMRSAGIDPATGEEIFIKKNGEYTYNYDPNQRVAVGNTNPTLQGSWMNTVRYKGFSLSVSTSYTFGGDYYNSTIQNKVENIDAYHNVDERVFTERWRTPGDLSRYLRIDTAESSHYSERFVERRNELYISSIQLMYQFAPKTITRLGLRKLALGIGLSDIGYISTIHFERGTSYPYCRAVNLIFRPTF